MGLIPRMDNLQSRCNNLNRRQFLSRADTKKVDNKLLDRVFSMSFNRKFSKQSHKKLKMIEASLNGRLKVNWYRS